MKKIVKRPRRVREAPKECYFCVEKKEPRFTEVEIIRRYTSDRGKIIGRIRTGICGKHHRKLSEAIKYARHLALIPFVVQA